MPGWLPSSRRDIESNGLHHLSAIPASNANRRALNESVHHCRLCLPAFTPIVLLSDIMASSVPINTMAMPLASLRQPAVLAQSVDSTLFWPAAAETNIRLHSSGSDLLVTWLKRASGLARPPRTNSAQSPSAASVACSFPFEVRSHSEHCATHGVACPDCSSVIDSFESLDAIAI